MLLTGENFRIPLSDVNRLSYMQTYINMIVRILSVNAINAFCVTAMKQSKSVKYIKANTLMSEMEQARIKSTNLDYLNKLTKLDLLVIDDFGLMDLDLDKCRDLFEVLDTRDGRKSTVVISQFPVSTWFDMFADNTYADACLTRITDKHHTYRLEMNGINMRETE